MEHARRWWDEARRGASSGDAVAMLSLLIGSALLVVLLAAQLRTGAGPSDVVGGVGTGEVVVDPFAPVAAELLVHVTGAVRQPGLVRLTVGVDDRVADALAAAGGSQASADLAGINLARVLRDGEQLRVPVLGEEPAAIDGTDGPAAGRLPDGRIDLNAASASDFEELPGVGPVLAGRLVAWREANGPFVEVGQLREVSGIGERTFQNLAPLVGV